MNKARIVWIDIAKALAILCMIVGHIVPLGSSVRNLIYSFHMPLFFVLTGYTARDITSFAEFYKQVKKDITHIFIPYICIFLLDKIFGFVLQGEKISLMECIEVLIWSSAVEVKGHPLIGAIWFLNVLFLTKILYNLVQLLFASKYNGIVYMLLASLGQIIAIRQDWLPLSFDIVLTASLYLYIGHCLKDIWQIIEKKQMLFTIISWGIWMLCWNRGMYVEMATRYYPQFPLSILESICGCICIFTLSKVLESNVAIMKFLKWVGQHTLLILGIHHLSYRFSFLWIYDTKITCVIAIVVGIAIAKIITELRLKLRRMLRS